MFNMGITSSSSGSDDDSSSVDSSAESADMSLGEDEDPAAVSSLETTKEDIVNETKVSNVRSLGTESVIHNQLRTFQQNRQQRPVSQGTVKKQMDLKEAFEEAVISLHSVIDRIELKKTTMEGECPELPNSIEEPEDEMRIGALVNVMYSIVCECVTSEFPEDRSAQCTALTHLSNVVMKRDVLDLLHSVRENHPQWKAKATSVIETVVPHIWSS